MSPVVLFVSFPVYEPPGVGAADRAPSGVGLCDEPRTARRMGRAEARAIHGKTVRGS